MLIFGQKMKMPKTSQKTVYYDIKVVLCKTALKKTKKFEKEDNFENQPSSKGNLVARAFLRRGEEGREKTCQKNMPKTILLEY